MIMKILGIHSMTSIISRPRNQNTGRSSISVLTRTLGSFQQSLAVFFGVTVSTKSITSTAARTPLVFHQTIICSATISCTINGMTLDRLTYLCLQRLPLMARELVYQRRAKVTSMEDGSKIPLCEDGLARRP